jgi:hypothetical protein
MPIQRPYINGKPRTQLREYWIWNGIINRCVRRCQSPTMTKYYSKKGVVVAKSWQGPRGFDRFYAHAGPAPSPRHTIDRIKSVRGYVPGNVRWATMKEQQRNRRNNFNIRAFGRTQCISAWAEEMHIGRVTLRQRIRLGWEPERALSTPPRRLRKRV